MYPPITSGEDRLGQQNRGLQRRSAQQTADILTEQQASLTARSRLLSKEQSDAAKVLHDLRTAVITSTILDLKPKQIPFESTFSTLHQSAGHYGCTSCYIGYVKLLWSPGWVRDPKLLPRKNNT